MPEVAQLQVRISALLCPSLSLCVLNHPLRNSAGPGKEFNLEKAARSFRAARDGRAVGRKRLREEAQSVGVQGRPTAHLRAEAARTQAPARLSSQGLVHRKLCRIRISLGVSQAVGSSSSWPGPASFGAGARTEGGCIARIFRGGREALKWHAINTEKVLLPRDTPQPSSWGHAPVSQWQPKAGARLST